MSFWIWESGQFEFYSRHAPALCRRPLADYSSRPYRTGRNDVLFRLSSRIYLLLYCPRAAAARGHWSDPDGIRANFYVIGGEVEGPKLNGKIVPVGADWLLIRRDGVAILDVRATIETHDGALIYVPYTGISDLGPDGYDRFISGNLPQRGTIRAVPRFQTSHPNYLWLNRLQCLNVGDVDLGTGLVRYDVYAA